MKKEEVKEKNKIKDTKTNKQKNNSIKEKQNPKETVKKKTTTTKTKVEVTEIVEEVKVDTKDEVKKEINKKNKRLIDAILVVGLIIVLILGSLVMNGEKPKPAYKLPLKLTGEAGLHQLTYQEYEEKIESNEAFVLIIERATCSHCVTYMPIAEKFANDNNVPMYYVDTDTFTEEDWSKFETSNEYLEENQGNWGTPTTIVLSGEAEVDSIVGTTSEEQLKDLYNKYFEIKEETEE